MMLMDVQTILRRLLSDKPWHFASDIATYVASPTCPANQATAVSKRWANSDSISWSNGSVTAESLEPYIGERGLVSRDELLLPFTDITEALTDIIKSLLSGQSNSWVNSEQTAWTNGLASTFGNLANLPLLSGFLKGWELPNLAYYTPAILAGFLLCSPDSFDKRIGGSTEYISCAVDLWFVLFLVTPCSP